MGASGLQAIVLNTLLPPFSLLVVVLAFSYWAAPRHRRALVALVGAVAILLHVPLVGRALIAPLSWGVPSLVDAEAPTPQAVVVPTGGAMVLASGRVWPEDETAVRYERGLVLAASLSIPLAIVGGPAGGLPVAESRAVVAALGEPSAVSLLVGDRSLDTCENAVEAADLLRPLGVDTVLAVTSWRHGPRWAACLRRAGLRPVLPPPLPIRSWREDPTGTILPGARGAAVLNAAARGYAGVLWYLLSGRIDIRDLGGDGREP